MSSSAAFKSSRVALSFYALFLSLLSEILLVPGGADFGMYFFGLRGALGFGLLAERP